MSFKFIIYEDKLKDEERALIYPAVKISQNGVAGV